MLNYNQKREKEKRVVLVAGFVVIRDPGDRDLVFRIRGNHHFPDTNKSIDLTLSLLRVLYFYLAVKCAQKIKVTRTSTTYVPLRYY